MKVALIVRSTIESVPGGDSVQVFNTKKSLEGLGITCEINYSSREVHYSKYHLLHFFNLTRPAEITAHAFRSKLPFLVSPIFIDYSEYDQYHRKGLSGFMLRNLPRRSQESFKSFARWLNGSDPGAGLHHLLKGHRSLIMKILNAASMFLPNSESERSRISEYFKVDFPYRIIPNGIDSSVFTPDRYAKRDPRLVICVARIEGIKNQLNLIRALNNTEYTLLIIGDQAPNQLKYFLECKKVACSNIKFIPRISQQELCYYYSRASIHALPSWFETTGLSSLEAAAMGCNAVVSKKGDVYDYLGDEVTYCDPSSPTSIYNAISKASYRPSSNVLADRIRKNFQWDIAALRTREAYLEVLGKQMN